MHRRLLVSMIAAAASAATLLTCGCASSVTESSAVTGTSAVTTTAAGGTVHFIGYSQNSDGPDLTVILTGAIGDYGPAVTIHPNGTIDPEHSSELGLGLRDGSFRLYIASLDKKIVSEDSLWRSDKTCSFHLSVTAATPIVAGSGTGSYRGISGNITTTVTIDEVDVKPCPGGTSRFLAQLIVMVGSGTVSFG